MTLSNAQAAYVGRIAERDADEGSLILAQRTSTRNVTVQWRNCGEIVTVVVDPDGEERKRHPPRRDGS